MDYVVWIELALFVILLCFSGFFSSSETALFSLDPVEFEQMRRDEDENLELIQRLLSEPRRLIVTILIGNEFVNVAASVISASIIIQLLGAENKFLNLLVMVPILLLFGEITPKTLALRHNTTFASFQSRPIDLFSKLIFPLRWMVRLIADWITTLIVGSELTRGNIVTEDMITTLAHEAEIEGVLDHQEAKFIDQIFEFGHKTVGDILTPRSAIFYLSADLPLNEIIVQVRMTKHTQIPIYTGNRDTIVGILFARDLLNVDLAQAIEQNRRVEEFVRKPYLVPVTKSAISLFHAFKNSRRSFALVVDEFGGVVGLVTMKSLLGQIFGHIRSLSSAAPMQSVQHLEEQGVYVLEGEMKIHDFNRELGMKLPDKHAQSLAGLILHQYGELPTVDTIVDLEGGRFCVVQLDNNHVTKLLFSRDVNAQISSDMLATINNNPVDEIEFDEVEEQQDKQEDR